MKQIFDQLDQLPALIGAAYANEISGTKIGYYILDSDKNFFRDTPKRKVLVLDYFSGDYEHQSADEIDEFGDQESINRVYEAANAHLLDKLSYLKLVDLDATPWPKDMAGYSDFLDDAKEDLELCDSEGETYLWTPYADGGALLDEGGLEYVLWETQDEYIALQKAKVTGDGNYYYCAMVTVTPRLKAAPHK